MAEKRLYHFHEFTLMRILKQNNILLNAMFGYAVPPLETAGTVVLVSYLLIPLHPWLYWHLVSHYLICHHLV